MFDIDVVCPIYFDIKQITRFVDNIKKQKNVNIVNMVFPHTLCGDDSIDDEIKKIVNSYKTFCFEKKEFSHSLTREKAIRDFCSSDIVVLMSQDVILFDENSICNLVKNVDDEIIYVYGRQICTNKSIEKYIRKKNYGEISYIVDKNRIDEMQLMAFFASDAFSAINRKKFLELNGYQGYDVMMNEDQLFSKFILDAGYKKMYVADAIIEHSHKYTLKQLYRRYYETGVFYSQVKMFNQYKSANSGFKLALYVLKESLRHFDIPVLIRWFPDMLARFLGMRRGKNENK